MKKNSTHHNRALQAPLSGIGQADLDAINILHRHRGFITIEQLPEGGGCKRMFKGLPASLISDPLSAPLPELYLPVNGLRTPWRNGSNVSYLNAVWADVDIYKVPGAKTEIEIGRFMDLADDGKVPSPSVVVRSGRGAWFMYLLREDQSDRSVPKTFAALELWGRLQDRFANLLTENGFIPDRQARDVSHLIRVPGSLNSKAGQPVAYTVSHGAGGKVIAYTMDELAREMRLPAAPAPTVSRWHGFTAAPASAQPSRPSTGVKVPKRRAGQLALIALRERRFWLVVGMRGGAIKEGSRNALALCLSSILNGDPDRIVKVWRFGKLTCRPALTDGKIISLLKIPYILTDADIWGRLDLTNAEGVRLDIDHDRNPLAPRQNKGQATARLRRRHDIVRAALACYLTNGSKPAPAAQIVFAIRQAGLKYSRRTLLRDLTEMRRSGSLAL
jgi:hypothetical protein